MTENEPVVLPPAPRKVHIISYMGLCRFAVWAIALGILIIAPLKERAALSRLSKLQQVGKVYQADILDREETTGKGAHCDITVTFGEEGDYAQGKRSVPKSLYDEYLGQNQIPVTAMPGNNQDFEIGPVDDNVIDSARLAWNVPIFIFGGGMILAVIGFEVALATERKLLTYGEPVRAKILACKVVQGKGKSSYITYEYETHLGVRRGKRSVNGDMSATYPPGCWIDVLYLKSNDKVSRPLNMFSMAEIDGQPG
jgi:hypothetical protein